MKAADLVEYIKSRLDTSCDSELPELDDAVVEETGQGCNGLRIHCNDGTEWEITVTSVE